MNEIMFNPGVMSETMNLKAVSKSATSGFAFFPYGDGIISKGANSIPEKCIMVLGQDFGTQAYVDKQDFILNGEEPLGLPFQFSSIITIIR